MPPSAGLSAVNDLQSAKEQLLAAATRRPARKAARSFRHSEAAGVVLAKPLPDAKEREAAALADALALPPPAHRKRRRVQCTPQDQAQQPDDLAGVAVDEAMPDAMAASAPTSDPAP
jgi:hypothetical protein